jgi:hypothetical protein
MIGNKNLFRVRVSMVQMEAYLLDEPIKYVQAFLFHENIDTKSLIGEMINRMSGQKVAERRWKSAR